VEDFGDEGTRVDDQISSIVPFGRRCLLVFNEWEYNKLEDVRCSFEDIGDVIRGMSVSSFIDDSQS